MIDLTVNLTMSDGLANLVTREALTAIPGRAAAAIRDLLKDHFQRRSQATGSRHYWGDAADSVESSDTGIGTAKVTISHVGVRLHWLGGTVRPSGKTSEATGRPIRSLLIPFGNSPLASRGITLAEAGIPEGEIKVLCSVKTRQPYLARVQERKRMVKGMKQKVTPLGVLVKSAKHDADPSVMPTAEELAATAHDAATAFLATSIRTRSPRS